MARFSDENDDLHLTSITAKNNLRIAESKKEYKKNMEIEERLASVSKFSFQEVDFNSQLERRAFQEQPLEDLSYLYDEVKFKINSHFDPLISRYFRGIGISVLIMLLWGGLMSSKNTFYLPLLLLFLTVGVFCTVLLYHNMRVKGEKLQIESIRISELIEKRMMSAIVERKRKKEEFEKIEETRLREIKDVVEGNVGAVLHYLSISLPQKSFPFLVSLDVVVCEAIPLFKIYLPLKSVIPTHATILQTSGKLIYEKKTIETLNKQYFELCAAVCIRILATIYEHALAFDKGYLHAVIKDDIGERLVITAQVNRAKIKEACQKLNGIAALQFLEANYILDEEFYLIKIPDDDVFPPEWGDFVERMLKRIHIKIFR